MNYKDLDPGIRDTVKLLNDEGFVTTDSGDGVSKPVEWFEKGYAMPFPHVVAETTPESMLHDALRMAACLGDEWNVEAVYQTLTNHAHLFARTLFPGELP